MLAACLKMLLTAFPLCQMLASHTYCWGDWQTSPAAGGPEGHDYGEDTVIFTFIGGE